MIIKFKAKTVAIGSSLGVIIPRSYFNNGLLETKKEYEFVVQELEEQETDTCQN